MRSTQRAPFRSQSGSIRLLTISDSSGTLMENGVTSCMYVPSRPAWRVRVPQHLGGAVQAREVRCCVVLLQSARSRGGAGEAAPAPAGEGRVTVRARSSEAPCRGAAGGSSPLRTPSSRTSSAAPPHSVRTRPPPTCLPSDDLSITYIYTLCRIIMLKTAEPISIKEVKVKLHTARQSFN